MIAEQVRQMSVEEFLDFAENSEDRYEYIDGELYQMTGGKLNHFTIIANVTGRFQTLLADTHCLVVGSGMLVKAGGARLVAPDVSVVRGEPETEANTRILLNPILVVEVTSPSSIEHDRISKRDYYRDVASIEAYLIVDQHRVLVELYTRSETGWHIQCFSDLGDEVPLAAVDCSLPLRDIYQRIGFDEELPAPAEDA
ncbi:MAG: Uma2 family endonuclease [Chloroflexota bacterium]|nr:Uma2 family endonuclease [Chloroflexota bacterium]